MRMRKLRNTNNTTRTTAKASLAVIVEIDLAVLRENENSDECDGDDGGRRSEGAGDPFLRILPSVPQMTVRFCWLSVSRKKQNESECFKNHITRNSF